MDDPNAPTSVTSLSLFEYDFDTVSPDAEVLRRTETTRTLYGQAAFFSLVNRLNIPVLNNSSNSSGGQDHVFVGTGASYGVTRPLIRHDHASINNSKGKELEKDLLSRKFVTKKIVPILSKSVSDAQQLAAITNEVRILGNRTVKQTKCLVQLLCVAWDELPRGGRYWPRLLLEAADHGNLAAFMAQSADIADWKVKLDLNLDILSGLAVLHNHRIAHCDLKVENVLIFQEQDTTKVDKSKYVAKLCDFGFSVIMNDYDNDAMFSARLGTEPWTAPELTFGTKVKVDDLPQADIFSFGLLFSRIYMHGGDPFESLILDKTREMKRDEDAMMRLVDFLKTKIFERVAYTESQQLLINKTLLVTLRYKPEHRFPIRLIGPQLILLGVLFTDHPTAEADNSEPEETHSEKPLAASPQLNPPGGLWWNMVNIASQGFSIIMKPLNVLRGAVKSGLLSVLRLVLKRMGLLKDPFEDLWKPKYMEVQPISRVAGLLDTQRNVASESDNRDFLSALPDFEYTTKYAHFTLPRGVAKELVEDLNCKVQESSTSVSAEASFQLAIAHFEGIGTSRNVEQGLQWLKTAHFKQSAKGISSLEPVFSSLGFRVPHDIDAITRSKLPDLASNELLVSLSDVHGNKISQPQTFTALRQWIRSNPREYNEYLCSSIYGSLKITCLGIYILAIQSSLEGQTKSEEDRFDSDSLEGYNPHEKFQLSQKASFIESVRKLKCVQKADLFSVTLLQRAAAMGDLELAKTLVLDLGAEVDYVGTTPSYTPLWISCASGNIDVASFLFEHGADATHRDTKTGRTILHFLNQCRDTADLVRLFEISSKGGLVDLEIRDASGNTPLLSTFCGWDFSNGDAARYLVGLKATAVVKSKDLWTPMTAAAAAFNVDLIREIYQNHDSSLLSGAASLTRPDQSLGEAKVEAFQQICGMNDFLRRRIGGATAMSKLTELVNLLMDPEMLEHFSLSEFSQGTNPLISTCYQGHVDMVSAVLDATNSPDLNEVDDQNGMSALHWAAERGRVEVAFLLLRRGADPMIQDRVEGLTVFHRAARFFPDLLLKLINAIEDGSLPCPEGMDIYTILNTKSHDDHTVFMTALIEGAKEHLKFAEHIRTRYNLDYDMDLISHEGKMVNRMETTMTFTAYMVENAIMSNLFTLEQMEYLIEMNPRPRFIADSLGRTLLHYAVMGTQHDSMGSNPTGYATLRLLLRTFPGKEYLEIADNTGSSTLHYAAFCSNAVAIEIIRDHFQSIGKELNPNLINKNGSTPLDGLGLQLKRFRFEESELRTITAGFRRNTARSYEYMRNLGAYLSSEQIGIPLWIVTRRTAELPREALIEFFITVQMSMGLTWELVEDDSEKPRDAMSDSIYVMELCWCFDRFILRAKEVMPHTIAAYIQERLAQRSRRTDNSGPWEETTYEETIYDHTVKWTRSGRSWNNDEISTLVQELLVRWMVLIEEEEGLLGVVQVNLGS
ncbi:hypothetical protein PFICI_11485 [Pestalotiopsis fici W106-1]|uniref:protein S-acyltransferase n=1 Tax=Pestalotiopsis fici (strain W106-1 / CGMCC3.15140) TaxID=1229662 RepID=W3WQH2_PESFW|nr:uncharacterized protein PFICI_11485 [Pestalotiopsis fici W106-1]ETS76098.1 hypothetical protein PFICI_11485 [Pestalotiopsis fici W106-1]